MPNLIFPITVEADHLAPRPGKQSRFDVPSIRLVTQKEAAAALAHSAATPTVLLSYRNAVILLPGTVLQQLVHSLSITLWQGQCHFDPSNQPNGWRG